MNTITNKLLVACLALCCLFAGFGCKKKQDTSADYAAAFTEFHGFSCSCCGGLSSYIVIAKGTETNKVTITGTNISQNNCWKPITLNAVATENALTIPSQVFNDGCGVAVTVSGYVTLEPQLVTMSITATSATLSRTCYYYCNK